MEPAAGRIETKAVLNWCFKIFGSAVTLSFVFDN
jgi:hypothetical protein